MARESKPPAPPPDSDKPAASDAAPVRPGTSGTEMMLVTNTRKASDKFREAQRAERNYIARKRSAVARANAAEAKSHLRDGLRHLASAMKLGVAVCRFSPYFLSEKGEVRQRKAEEKKRARAMERMKRLEKQMARESLAAEGALADGEEAEAEAEGSGKGKAKAK